MSMKDVLIVVSTCNRRDLTGITLDSIKHNKHPDTEVLIVDDHSKDYNPDWLRRWGWRVTQSEIDFSIPACIRIGKVARLRLTSFLALDKQFLIAMDNDLATAWRFDCKLLRLLREYPDTHRLLVTGYICNMVVEKQDMWCRISAGAGLLQCMSRTTAEYFLKAMTDTDWATGYDHRISGYAGNIICTPRSVVQHLGDYGTGFHVYESGHRAVDFIGDTSIGGKSYENTCSACQQHRYPDDVVPSANLSPGLCSVCSKQFSDYQEICHQLKIKL